MQTFFHFCPKPRALYPLLKHYNQHYKAVCGALWLALYEHFRSIIRWTLVINTVVGRKKQSHPAQVHILDLSKLFGDVVHDPQRPPQLCSPSGPMAEGAFTDFSVVTVEDVASSLKSVNPFKATGSDQVPSIILQKRYLTIAPTLTRLINTSMSSGEFPLSFKLSHVSPLFKSGDPTLPKNYRPVSLLPVISRITEAFVKKSDHPVLGLQATSSAYSVRLPKASLHRRCLRGVVAKVFCRP